MRVQKKQIFLTTFSLAALLVLLQLFQVSAQMESEGDKATKKFLDNVVQLSVNFSNGKSQNGFGFVVGERHELLYVVTANHVVRKDEPGTQTTNIKAKFYSDKGDPEKAKLLQLSAGEVDLALLEIHKPYPSYQWKANYFSSPQKNSTVWFIGRDEDWWVPADIEAGVIKDLPILPTFPVRIRSVHPGTSGAPLISKEGIVGMIIEDELIGKAEALDIETIHKIVTLKWNYPWGLKQGGGKIPTPESTKPADVKTSESKAKKEYKNEKGFLERDYGNGIIMVYIPPGEFTMGSEDYDDEKPTHKVDLGGYWMGKTEVTVKQFSLFVKDKGYVTEAESSGGAYILTGEKMEKKEGINWKNPGFKQEDNHPVVCVSWNDAVEYCKWLSVKKGVNFKLPTEAQWEKAARGTDQRKYPWGSHEPYYNGKWYANYAAHDRWDKRGEDGFAFTAPVDSYPQGASSYGLLDMAGNVLEWCSDWYKADYYKDSEATKKDPSGPGSGTERVLRGGGWGIEAVGLRCSNRYVDTTFRDNVVGFRLCQDN
jgi:formylglycine-generating enzyme required for sulfatase activity